MKTEKVDFILFHIAIIALTIVAVLFINGCRTLDKSERPRGSMRMERP